MITEVVMMSDGTPIEVLSVMPEGTPKAHIHLVHGMAEHIGRYERTAELLAAQGYAVTGHNQRGHGGLAEKAGQLGDFEDGVTFDRLVEDVREVLNVFKLRRGGLKTILFGHSMGSFVVRRFAQLYGREIEGLICSGTAGKPGATAAGGIALSSVLSAKDGRHAPSHVLNTLGFGSYNRTIDNPETPFDWLSTDKETVQAYIDDPLSGAVSTNAFFRVLFEGLNTISSAGSNSTVPSGLPVLFFSGSSDPVGNMGSGVFEAAGLFSSAGVRDVTVFLAEGERHETLSGPPSDLVLPMMTDWISKRW
ncbi:alpha/beta hydrolase [Sporosarcina sp. NCCP-2716]|uniref:alpha/beta fold hydrolase n=1 Tax=Sporosarcina sp. NCCP-2716 TaxID=2943679 RepID=UPI00203C869C|nr:alpha/beta fold hydrolase [Sporosarcina sp. NCCP-2716]GKV67876.1 alpha/beta hydrolase [Sporosarcina sp. NCCP-2716]